MHAQTDLVELFTFHYIARIGFIETHETYLPTQSVYSATNVNELLLFAMRDQTDLEL